VSLEGYSDGDCEEYPLSSEYDASNEINRLLYLLFDPEDGVVRSCGNVSKCIPDYMTSNPRSWYSP
jgi:hypothetical protein